MTNGLSMAFHERGYRKEDGYNAGNLFKDTAKSAVEGGIAGFAFDWKPKHVKIDAVTKGKGSYLSVWKQVMTKAQRGQIKNIKVRTLWKGVVSYGVVRSADTFIEKGIDTIKEKLKSGVRTAIVDSARDLFGGRTITASSNRRNFLAGNRTAVCPAMG